MVRPRIRAFRRPPQGGWRLAGAQDVVSGHHRHHLRRRPPPHSLFETRRCAPCRCARTHSRNRCTRCRTRPALVRCFDGHGMPADGHLWAATRAGPRSANTSTRTGTHTRPRQSCTQITQSRKTTSARAPCKGSTRDCSLRTALSWSWEVRAGTMARAAHQAKELGRAGWLLKGVYLDAWGTSPRG